MEEPEYSDSSEDEPSNTNNNNNNKQSYYPKQNYLTQPTKTSNNQKYPTNTSEISNKINYSNPSQQVNINKNNDNNYNYDYSTEEDEQNGTHNIQSNTNVNKSAINYQPKVSSNIYDNVTYSDEDDEEPVNNQIRQRYPIQSNINTTKGGNTSNYNNSQSMNRPNINNSENKEESKSNIYPKLFHMKFIQNTWNPWNQQNCNDKRSYCIVNKSGGPGIDGNRPRIVYKEQSEQRNNDSYNRIGGRGQGMYNNNRNYNNYNNNNRGCYICGDMSHIKRYCPQNNNNNNNNYGNNSNSGCYICGDMSHMKRDCPQNNQYRGGRGGRYYAKRNW